MGRWESPGTPAARRVAAEAVAENVDGGLAELIPDRERSRAWTLLIDGALQSHVDLDDPAYLSFEYQRRLGTSSTWPFRRASPCRPCTSAVAPSPLARYVAATRPRSTQQVVEKDAGLVQLVRRELPWTPARGSGCAPPTPAPG